jgi:pimeloyl-ACP methyl ester carboxylesterase
MKPAKWITGLAAAAAVSGLILCLTTTAHASAKRPESARADAKELSCHTAKPTVVLVHGAWADASGWTRVIERLDKAGYPVAAPPNPLRGLTYDADYIHSALEQIKGPIILVGHSYGGAVITNAAVGDHNVKALVYIAAFAPAKGESLESLNDSALGKTIPALPLETSTFPAPSGGMAVELTIDPAKYPSVFLDNELPRYEEEAMAAEQRPLSLASVTETSGTPAWKTIPSWYMVATHDHAIAPALERFMAARMHAHTVQVAGPHLIMVTNPGPVTSLIEQAAVTTTGC